MAQFGVGEPVLQAGYLDEVADEPQGQGQAEGGEGAVAAAQQCAAQGGGGQAGEEEDEMTV